MPPTGSSIPQTQWIGHMRVEGQVIAQKNNWTITTHIFLERRYNELRHAWQMWGGGFPWIVLTDNLPPYDDAAIKFLGWEGILSINQGRKPCNKRPVQVFKLVWLS